VAHKPFHHVEVGPAVATAALFHHLVHRDLLGVRISDGLYAPKSRGAQFGVVRTDGL
jgi:hypothetical protein